MSLICIVAIDSAIIGRAEFRLGKTAYYGWVTYVRPRIKKVRDSRFVYAETTLNRELCSSLRLMQDLLARMSLHLETAASA